MFSLIFLGVLTQNVICEFSNVINDPKNAWKTLEKLESIYARVTNVTWPLPAPRKSKRNIEWELDARAAIDGCFCQSTNQSLPGACTADELNEGCKNKISESYAWGVTRTRSSIYWVIHHLFTLLYSLFWCNLGNNSKYCMFKYQYLLCY
jgi:hypothetical protein